MMRNLITRMMRRAFARSLCINIGRRGLGRAILEKCEGAIQSAGFRSAELASTLTGIPFYATFDYVSAEQYEVPLANGLTLPVVRMTKDFA